MTNESALREALAEIDRIRVKAKIAEEMNAHWLGHDGELVTIKTVVVRRRWRDKTVHSEIVMSKKERDLFLDWLDAYGKTLRAEADQLTQLLEEGATDD
jgi:hypothetical protein